jgi:hypothetical protein
MWLNGGKLNVANLLKGDPAGVQITDIAVGTSNTAVTPSDTAITGQVAKPITSAVFNPVTNKLTFSATLAGGDPAMTIQEMGLLNSNGDLVHRIVVSPKVKVAGLTYALTYEVNLI